MVYACKITVIVLLSIIYQILSPSYIKSPFKGMPKAILFYFLHVAVGTL